MESIKILGQKSQKGMLPEALKSNAKNRQPEVKPAQLLPPPHGEWIKYRSLLVAPHAGSRYQARLNE